MRFSILRPLALAATLALWLPAQINPLSATAAGSMTAQRGGAATGVVRVTLNSGYHVNSNTPSDEFLIPLRLTWDPAPLEVKQVVFPEPQLESYAFSGTKLSVFTGDFEIRTRFAVPANAPVGLRTLSGKLRYQACTERSCLAPRTLTVELPVMIR